MFSILIYLFFGFNAILFAQAEIYATRPACGSTCNAGSDCTIEWLPGPKAPPLSEIGDSTIGLYTKNMQLVQPIATLNVAFQHSINFIPNPRCGPNLNEAVYYIAFKSLRATTNGTLHMDFSPFFSINGMTGSPDSTECSSQPFSTIVAPSPGEISTTTVGSFTTPGRFTATSRFTTPTAVINTHYSFPTTPSTSTSSKVNGTSSTASRSSTSSRASSSSSAASQSSAGRGIPQRARGASISAVLALVGFALVL